MARLNISIPEQLHEWINQQVSMGRYASANDYLRDLILNDQRTQQSGWNWLTDHLQPLMNTPEDKFVFVSADDVKARGRQRIKEQE